MSNESTALAIPTQNEVSSTTSVNSPVPTPNIFAQLATLKAEEQKYGLIDTSIKSAEKALVVLGQAYFTSTLEQKKIELQETNAKFKYDLEKREKELCADIEKVKIEHKTLAENYEKKMAVKKSMHEQSINNDYKKHSELLELEKQKVAIKREKAELEKLKLQLDLKENKEFSTKNEQMFFTQANKKSSLEERKRNYIVEQIVKKVSELQENDKQLLKKHLVNYFEENNLLNNLKNGTQENTFIETSAKQLQEEIKNLAGIEQYEDIAYKLDAILNQSFTANLSSPQPSTQG